VACYEARHVIGAALHEWHFEDFLVLNRPVTEVAVFAEQLAMVGGDRHIGVLIAVRQGAADCGFIEVLEHAVHAIDARPLSGRLTRQGIRIVPRRSLNFSNSRL
jgi:hypothetical protein